MDQQLKITEKHVADLEKELGDKDSTINLYRRQSVAQDQEIRELEDNILELRYQQQQLQEQIDRIEADYPDYMN